MKAKRWLCAVLNIAVPLCSACGAAGTELTLSRALSASGWLELQPDLTKAEAEQMAAPLGLMDARKFMEKAYGMILARSPETAYAAGVSRIYGIPEDELSDLSDEHALGTRELYLALLEQTRSRLAASGGDRTLEAFARWLDDKAREIELSLCRYPVMPYVNSPDQLAMDYFTEYRTVRDEAEAERYIACLSLLPRKMAGLSAALDRRAKAGVVLPRGVYEFTLQSLRDVAYSTPLGSPFYEAFADKLASSSVPPGRRRDDLLARAEAAIEANVLPAWRLLVEALERQSGAVPDEGGALRLPGGEAYYAACLARQTTTAMSAEEIHGLGLRELARVDSEIRALFRELGYPEGASLGELYARLGRETGNLSGDDLLARVNGLIRRMDARLDEVVSKRPAATVEAVYGEIGAYYQSPSLDGSRPGRYFLAEGERRPVYDIPSTVYHETLPGHHLQIALALEADLPGFIRGADFLAHIEGWALYAERLAYEMGFYEDNVPGDLGRLRMEALRAARLVADTGVNALGWTWAEAVAFLEKSTGLGAAMVQSDVSRYIVDPGQAVTYYVGYLRILELRERCRSELGAAFDQRRFNDALLDNGVLPLDALSAYVDDFIAREKAVP